MKMLQMQASDSMNTKTVKGSCRNKQLPFAMSEKDAYKKKAEAEVDLAQARLAEFKAKVKDCKPDTHVTFAEQVDHLEKAVDDAKKMLKELGEAGEDVWEKFKDGVESALRSLSASIKDIADKIKN